MSIQHQSGETKGSFYIEEYGDVKAQLSCSKIGDTGIIIDHTGVSDELRGKDVGRKLVEYAVEPALSLRKVGY